MDWQNALQNFLAECFSTKWEPFLPITIFNFTRFYLHNYSFYMILEYLWRSI